VSSASSEERWHERVMQARNAQESHPPPTTTFGIAPPQARTDTLSSSGSASSEMSDRPYARRQGIGLNKRGDIRYPLDLSSAQSTAVIVPPLPPRTYKSKLRQSNTATNQEQLPEFYRPSRGSIRAALNRTQSEEYLSTSLSAGPVIYEDYRGVVSARPATCQSADHTGNVNISSARIMEEAAKMILSNPELGKCQLRLQKALQEKCSLENVVQQLRSELEIERRSHQQTKNDLRVCQQQLFERHANSPSMIAHDL